MDNRPPRRESTEPNTYVGAVDHYTSPARRDPVKTLWEEPATRKILDETIDRFANVETLRVLDIGAGAGDGLALLQSTAACQRRRLAGRKIDYVGLDIDEQLLDTGRWLHEHAQFVLGDVRDGIPSGRFDIYLSCGAPYSHLTAQELEQVLTVMFVAARVNGAPAAIIIDVLGRYSIEWSSCWDQQWWPYRMSFFRSDQPAASTYMTFYSGAELHALVCRAAVAAGCPVTDVRCYDRSIMVGRHTSTGDFAPGLRPYRTLVNKLVDPGVVVDYDELLFDFPLPDAPPSITGFFSQFARDWNILVYQVRDFSATVVNTEYVAAVVQPMLAHGLERLEATMQRGLGVGHSLTAVAYIEQQR